MSIENPTPYQSGPEAESVGDKVEVQVENKSVKDQLIESGIAERIVGKIKQSIEERNLNRSKEDSEYADLPPENSSFGIEDCDFQVIKFERDGQNYVSVVIEKPNPHTINAQNQPRVTEEFEVKAGKSFGAYGDKPLTDEQFELVMSLADKNESF